MCQYRLCRNRPCCATKELTIKHVNSQKYEKESNHSHSAACVAIVTHPRASMARVQVKQLKGVGGGGTEIYYSVC